MKAWVELWVRLKVVDLVTQTAWMTLTEKLEFENELCGLVRYSYWGMYAQGENENAILDDVDRVVRMDSAFTNQNKHLYRLMIRESAGGSGDPRESNTTGTPGAAAGFEVDPASIRGDLPLEKDFPVQGMDIDPAVDRGIFSCDCLIRERDGDKEKSYFNRLNARLKGVSVSGLKAGEVWRILIRAAAREEALERIELMAVTRSRREGLLLNPHYQQYEIISAFRLGEAGP